MKIILLQWLAFVLWSVSIPFFANVFGWRIHETEPPDLLDNAATAAEWEAVRRPELVKLFETVVYGALPTDNVEMSAEVLEAGTAFEGTDHEAERRQVALTLSRTGHSATLQLLMYTPVQCSDIAQGCPTVVSLNFFGNHSLTADSDVIPSIVWSQRIPGKRVPFKEESRNSRHTHMPVEELLSEGYAVVTAYYGDIDPDFNDGFTNGVHALFPERAPGSWGSVSAWAWGMSRVMDYLEQDAHPYIDAKRVALFGFSRLGKSALWAAANDPRFAAIIDDSAGEGGDTLSHRNFGETIHLMTLRFPHWFNRTYKTYAGRERELPVDQHMLLALAAPRPLLISAAAGDWWSDSKGAAEAASAASAAYALYGAKNKLVFDVHEGKHDVTLGEWEAYLGFLDSHL